MTVGELVPVILINCKYSVGTTSPPFSFRQTGEVVFAYKDILGASTREGGSTQVNIDVSPRVSPVPFSVNYVEHIIIGSVKVPWSQLVFGCLLYPLISLKLNT